MNLVKKFLNLPIHLQLEIAFYPLFLIYRMPIAWAKSLWAARILLNGRWHRYMGFHPHNAINSLFYRTQWLNLERYGRSGISPVLGLGHFRLSNWWHLSLLSSYIYANAGAVTTLLGTLIWVFSHLLWVDSLTGWWAVAITGILFFSSTAYAMAFARQNYQILGWMWLPVTLYAISQGYWMLASLAWLAAASAGLTPIFFALPIASVLSITHGGWEPLLTLAPALALVLGRFIHPFRHGDFHESIVKIGKLIGVTSQNVRYHREMDRLDIFTVYFFGLYVTCAIVFGILTQTVPALLVTGAFLFLINQRFFRVADEQSLIMIVVSLFAFEAMQEAPHWSIGGVLWLASSPLAWFLSIQPLRKESTNTAILVNAPFDHRLVEQEIKRLFSEITVGQRVYFAFADPKGKYANLFDGYRVIHELPLSIAGEKGIHLFPDWYAVAETNYEGAPQCWGRSPAEVKENILRWNADYAVIYQETDTQLDVIWEEEFQQVAEFDWAPHISMFRGVPLWPRIQPTPKWFLLTPCFPCSEHLQRSVLDEKQGKSA